jgi:signal transduction histidine kinase
MASWMKNTGILLPTRSQLPSFVYSLTANPRTSRARSAEPLLPATVEVEVRALREVDHAVVAVRDSGRGMKPEFLPRVFEPFAQEATAGAGRTDGGLGLGLAIVRHLIEAHAGSVMAHSDGEGLGAEFRVRLPALQEVL